MSSSKFRLMYVFNILVFSVCYASVAVAGDRPNIVLLLADDLGFSDLGSYGSQIDTPNIDQLASVGIRFSNYHTAASCAPTRSMLMTGVDSHRNGVANMPESLPSEQLGQPGYEGTLNKNVVTIATLLRDSGYHTYMAGKWHLGKSADLLPSGRGFERSFTMADTGADNWEQKPYLPIYSQANWFEDGIETTLPEDFYSSKNLVDKTIEYIGGNLADKKPFFAYVAFLAVHLPVQAPREYTQKYLGEFDQGWNELRKQRYEGAVKSGVLRDGIEMAEIPTTLDWASLTVEEKRYQSKRMAVYAGMVDAMDFHLGRLLTYLKKVDQYDNTVFIFLSDNGAEPSDPIQSLAFKLWMKISDYNSDYETLGEKGSYSSIGPSFASASTAPFAWYKFFAGEGGLRVPLIVSGLSSPLNGEVADAFSWVTDIVPTILDVAQVGIPEGRYNEKTVEPIVGRSLLPLIEGRVEQVYGDDEQIGYELGGNAALFKGDYKVLINRGPIGDGEWHLFNLKNDPGETLDLKNELPHVFEELMTNYGEYVVSNGVLPVPDGYDQRNQIAIYGIKKRIGSSYYTFISVFFLLVLAWVIWRRRYKAQRH